MNALVYSVLYFTHSQCLCVAAGRPGSALRAADGGECPARSVVSVFVLQARPVVERQHAVRERARVTPAAQTGLEAVFELLGNKEEDYGIDAGVDGGHVDADVVEDQQEIQEFTSLLTEVSIIDDLLQQATQMERKPAQGEDQHQAEHDLSDFSPLLEVLSQRDLQTFFLVLDHLAGHEAVENG